jgi:hypothetical protein
MNWPAELFQRVEPPSGFDKCRLRTSTQWLTWAKPIRRLLSEFTNQTAAWPEPHQVHLLGGVEFDHTFTVKPEFRHGLTCAQQITRLAENLLNVEPGQGVFLFRDLFDDGFNQRALPKLWAVLRDTIAARCGNPMAALYAPLSYVGRRAGDFPLHADLYTPEYLWNVFDRVPADGTGATKLLPLSEFFALAKSAQLSPATMKALRACFDAKQGGERFRRFYDLLHVNSDPIVQALEAVSDEKAVRLSLRQGEGYLIHDRAWLHGREVATGGITKSRVHRLVFNVIHTQEPAATSDP